jgi:hypothetical protein
MSKLFPRGAIPVEPFIVSNEEPRTKIRTDIMMMRLQDLVRDDIQCFYDDPMSFLEPEQNKSLDDAKFWLPEYQRMLMDCAKVVNLDFRTVVLEEASPYEIEYVNSLINPDYVGPDGKAPTQT